MQRYVKKPVEICAWQWTGQRRDLWPVLLRDSRQIGEVRDGRKINNLVIETLEGKLWASRNDWIIQGVKGELYPCKPDIFQQTYEAI